MNPEEGPRSPAHGTMVTPEPTAARSGAVSGVRVFRGWWVVLGAFLGFIVYASQCQSTFGVFIFCLGNEMGWSRSALSGVITLARLPEAAISPFVGSVVDRHGSRTVVLIGAFVVGASFFLLATVTEIWQLYLYRGVFMAVGAMLTGPLVIGVAVNNWFVEQRGRAQAVVRLGD